MTIHTANYAPEALGLTHHVQVVFAGQEQTQAAADKVVVVGKDNPDRFAKQRRAVGLMG
jgi:hypothetical protein